MVASLPTSNGYVDTPVRVVEVHEQNWYGVVVDDPTIAPVKLVYVGTKMVRLPVDVGYPLLVKLIAMRSVETHARRLLTT